MKNKALITELQLEGFLIEEDNNPVDAELLKWFLFALTGNGKTLSDLNEQEFYLFKQKLPQLFELLYRFKRNPILVTNNTL